MSKKNTELPDLFLNNITENQRCLVINNNSKINLEKLSLFFNKVNYLFFNENGKKHFSSNSEYIDLKNFTNFFQKHTFDLIVVSSWPKTESDELLKTFLEEIRHILKETGNLLLPFKNQDNFKELQIDSFLNELNFTISKNWVVPTLENPLYSGNLNDLKPLTWFFQNLENFIPSFKKKSFKKNLFLKSIKILNGKILPIFIKFLSPSFLVSCSPSKSISFESHILHKTKLNSSILINRPYKIMYILFDEFGNPKKTVSINKKNLFLEDNGSFFQNLEKNTVYRDWIEGRIIDPLNSNEIFLAIDWIIKFQTNSISQESMNDELNQQINSMKQIFSKTTISDLPLMDWLENYQNFVNELTIYKTNVHGDLSHKNMILSPSNTIDVIDFDFFQESGNPFDDISNFLFRYLIKSKYESRIDSFNSKLSKHNTRFTNEIKVIETKLSEHFNYKISIVLLMKIYFLKNIFTCLEKNSSYDDLLPFARILSNL